MRHLLLTAVAVTLCCAASATAASVITGKQIKNNSVSTKDIKNRSLRAIDFRPGTLRRGPAGPAGPAGVPGPAGGAGPAGPAGSARAYGYVDGAGNLLLARSRGVTRVSRLQAGTYCISIDDAVSPSTTVINAAIEFPTSDTTFGATGDEDTSHAQGTTVYESSACSDLAPAADFQVVTFTQEFDNGEFQGNTREDKDFVFVIP